MLRVGLTGELGSGKSTVARLLASHGAIVSSSDEMGRAMMQPGEPVYRAIVEHFGRGILLPDGRLNRPELARLAFDPEHPRAEELNAIVHPAVIAAQGRLTAEIARTHPDAILVIESALIFSTRHASAGESWSKRFDRIVLVTARDEIKIARFMSRATQGRQLSPAELDALKKDGLARLARQRTEDVPDFTLENNSGIDELTQQVDALWDELLTINKLVTPKLKTRD